MTYRKPGIRLTQEFVDLLPALAAFQLPNCIIGPAYKIYLEDLLGSYTGLSAGYPYASLMPGAIVDTAALDPAELPDHQFPVSVKLTDAKLRVVDERTTGYVDSVDETLLKDAGTDVFANVAPGDKLTIVSDYAPIVPARVDGLAGASNPNRISTAVTALFADVQVGDEVVVTGGTDVTPATYTVAQVISSTVLRLNTNVYVGLGSSNDVAFSIRRLTGVQNAGTYTVREKVDNNTLKLEAELSVVETHLVYSVVHQVAEIPLTRDTHYTVAAELVTLESGIQYDSFDVVDAQVKADYRALRNDLSGEVKDYADLAALQAEFGANEIVPANPLAYGLSIALQNTVTKVNGCALSELLVQSEQLAYTDALDTLKKSNMYALVPLTQNPVVHQMFKQHVEQMSTPEKLKWRVAICNRKLVTEEELVAETTTSGYRTIVQTKAEGIVALGDDSLGYATDIFAGVQRGDEVVIIAGTGVVPGNYPVTAKVSDHELTLGDGFTSTYSAMDIEFYVRRGDGLEADGITLYDHSAHFISDGVRAGMFVDSVHGRFAITQVVSETKIKIAQVPGVVSVQAPFTYTVVGTLTRTEQANYIKAYSASIGSRRVVMVWPDIVEIPEGSTIRQLPGFYLGCAVAALTTGLVPQQGFTNLSVSGFLGFQHSRRYFDDDQLDIIADGGTMIFDQDVPGSALWIRHELTTDRSSIKYQEYMVTKNVDFISYFIVSQYQPMIGKYNITQGTIDLMKQIAGGIIKYLAENLKVDKLGGVIKRGTLLYIKEGASIDTLEVKFKFGIPIPLNNIDITIQV